MLNHKTIISIISLSLGFEFEMIYFRTLYNIKKEIKKPEKYSP